MPIQAFVNNKNKIFIPKCEEFFQLWSKDTKYFTWNGKKISQPCQMKKNQVVKGQNQFVGF